MPTFGEVLQTARGLLSSGQLVAAEQHYRALVAAAPQAPEAWHELGLVHLQAKRPAEAIEFFQRALALVPDEPVMLSNLAVAYRALGRFDEAVDTLNRALSVGKPTAELYNNLALAHKDLKHHEQAEQAFDAALRLRPEYSTAHFNRANLFRENGRFHEALAGYQRSLALHPRDEGAHCQMGITYYELGRLDEALASFELALAIQPEYSEMRRSRGIVWLSQGNYAQGWPEFEWRWKCDDLARREFAQPRWDGSPLAGRKILLYAEQGLGDTLHFVRYVPDVALQGNVRLDVQPALVPLLRQSGFGQWLVETGSASDFDVQCPLMSLPGLLVEKAGQPFWPGPYLSADPQRVSHWRARIEALPGFRVGIVWAGNPQHTHDRYRSVALADFAPLAAVPGVTLVSLQHGSARDQLRQLEGSFHVVDLGEDFDAHGGAFMDAAAVIQQLDLVITVDTSAAHLAGGLGAKVWTILDFSPDWRWLTQGETTVWYPTMRLFRQRNLYHWPPVFQAMREELARLVATRPARP